MAIKAGVSGLLLSAVDGAPAWARLPAIIRKNGRVKTGESF
ncbi:MULTISPECIES: hypothetical protein [unclassified Burkholderia]|nr:MULTISPECIES: hypothetical protein [unclassified Burkholderia]